MRTLRVRDGVWLGNPAGIEPLKDARADPPGRLHRGAGRRPPACPRRRSQATVDRWNAAVRAGNDTDFGRFTPAKPDRAAREIGKAPFYAMQLFPMTRKSMGGLAIDADTRVVDEVRPADSGPVRRGRGHRRRRHQRELRRRGNVPGPVRVSRPAGRPGGGPGRARRPARARAGGRAGQDRGVPGPRLPGPRHHAAGRSAAPR